MARSTIATFLAGVKSGLLEGTTALSLSKGPILGWRRAIRIGR